MGDENNQKLNELFQGMKQAQPDNEYYSITLTASENDKLVWQSQSEFYGYTEEAKQPPREIRRACLVDGQKILDIWKEMDRPGLVVNNTTELALYFQLGGNAIIESAISKQYFPHIHEDQIVVPTGAIGVRPIAEVSPAALKHAPTAKLRMEIIKRDNYKCRICGRSPDANVDIVLNVHHYRPWSLGGLTEESNLITLCHTCHNGLDPHYDILLGNIFQETFNPYRQFISKVRSGEIDSEYHAGVQRYRKLVREIHNTRNNIPDKH
jgi:hypothetical protein